MGGLVDTVMNVVTLGAYGQKEAQKDATRAQQQADMEARRIAASQKPMEEAATTLVDTGVTGNTLGALGLMVDPTTPKKKATTGLGTTGSTGLSTTTTTSLGFGS